MNARNPLYLDWAATAYPDPEITEKVREVSEACFGNPSSIHRAGREAEKLLAESRKRLAAVLRCREEEVVFTSGGTEANNMALFSLLRGRKAKKIIISGIEHASIYQPAGTLKELGFDVAAIKTDRFGFIDPAAVEAELDERTALVALMLVNNETGAIQPVAEVARLLVEYRKNTGRKILLHTDAVQAFGKIPFKPVELGVDSASISAHKIGGPRGVGALYLRRGGSYLFLYSGGGQEGGQRPGTENLPGVCGFILAAEKKAVSLKANLESSAGLMSSLLAELQTMEGLTIIPPGRGDDKEKHFSPYILNLAFPPIPGEVTVRVLEEEGFLISTGSACSSKKKNRFRVVENMNIPKEIAISIVRISIGPETQKDDLRRFSAALKKRIPALLRITG